MSWMLTSSSEISSGLLCSPGSRWDKEMIFFYFFNKKIEKEGLGYSKT